MRDTLPLLRRSDFPAIRRQRLSTLQANITLYCNQQCLHCHVNASPRRTEFMSEETLDILLAVIDRHSVATLDITGGAPELHPRFRDLVRRARASGCHVIDRCNLTVLLEPGCETLAEFLAGQGVEIVASLPCYLQENVDAQRGDGVFTKSIEALRRLNALGYGMATNGAGDAGANGAGAQLALNLIYNPQGPTLPPPQEALEADYKRILQQRYGVYFNRLFTLCNMPIKRFGSTLLARSAFHDYLALLKGAHRPANLEQVMCRTLVSVDWRGQLYDCDFNQMLDLAMRDEAGRPLGLADLLSAEDPGALLAPIRVADHCYGCTAGQGSSCGGALDPDQGSTPGARQLQAGCDQ